MFDKSSDHGNDVTVAQFIFLFLALAILRKTSMEMNVNENFRCHYEKKKEQTNKQIDSNFSLSVLLSTIEMTSNFALEPLADISYERAT